MASVGSTPLALPTLGGPAASGPTTDAGGEARPSVPAPDVGRLPRSLILGGVIAALLVVAALGVALAVIGSDRDGEGLAGPSDPPAAGDLKIVDVANISVEVPAAWTVVKQDPDTIGVADLSARGLWLRSGSVAEAFTLDRLQQKLFDKLGEESPDARICAGPEASQVRGGPTEGRYFVICYTFVPQGGGQAARLADAYYVGLDTPGTTVFVMQLSASPATLEEFATGVRRLPAPQWKLFGG